MTNNSKYRNLHKSFFHHVKPAFLNRRGYWHIPKQKRMRGGDAWQDQGAQTETGRFNCGWKVERNDS